MTPTRLRILRAVFSFNIRTGRGITTCALADEMGLTRPTVWEHLARLQDDGWVYYPRARGTCNRTGFWADFYPRVAGDFGAAVDRVGAGAKKVRFVC